MTASVLWIERLRWGTAIAQTALIGAVGLGYVPNWPVIPMLLVWVVGCVSNAVLAVRRRRAEVPEPALAALLVLDTVLLTVLLFITGGSSSPFSLLFLVPVIGASFSLSARGAWSVLAVTGLAYLGLFGFGPAPAHHHGPAEMRAHVVGMFGAYVFTAPLLVVALTRIGVLRAEAEVRVVEALQMQSRTRHLASLATLAAGAAHELSTPLSTIMMVARELEHASTSDTVRQDLGLIREEVLTCQEILADLSADAGAGMGERDEWVDVAEVVHLSIKDAQYHPVEVQFCGEDIRVPLPRRMVRQMLRRLLGNARDASQEQIIRVRVTVCPEAVELEVADTGSGMTPEVAARCTEPFYTTKSEGEGTGLGLFFVCSVVRNYGGELRLDTAPGQGTTATLVIPTAEKAS